MYHHGQTKNAEHRMAYTDDGILVQEQWFWDNELHRVGGPAFIEYYADGTVYTEEYCINGDCHRLDGPALIQYDADGDVEVEAWYQDGVMHRDGDKPTEINYYKDEITSVEYRRYGIRHRTTGPQTIYYVCCSDEVRECKYWKNGDDVTDAVAEAGVAADHDSLLFFLEMI